MEVVEAAVMGFGSQVVYALLLGIPVACVAWTVTREEIFKEVRDALSAYQKRQKGSIWRQKLAYLPTCPYCFSHYVAALFVGLCQFRMLTMDWRGYIISLFTVVFLANVYLSAYNLLRAALRATTATADKAEAIARCEKRLAAAVEDMEPTAWNPMASVRDGHHVWIGQWPPLPPQDCRDGKQHDVGIRAEQR